MKKLKPCPFCNGLAEFVKESSFVSGWMAGFSAEVHCKICNATIDTGEMFVFRKKKESEEENHVRVTKIMNQALEDAILKWNKRVK